MLVACSLLVMLRKLAKADQFALASEFFLAIKKELDAKLKCSAEIISIPGNHDLDVAC